MKNKSIEPKGQKINNSEVIQPQEYQIKLESLLDKISSQNRYSNRISRLNYVNQQRFQSAKKQLDQLKLITRVQEVAQVQLTNLNHELSIQIKQLKEQLEITMKDLIQARKCIKGFQQKIKRLQQENLQLEKSFFAKKLNQIEVYNNLKTQVFDNFLESSVKNFLTKVEWTDSILVNHCRECVVRQCYSNFFQDLNNKLLLWERKKKTSRICELKSESTQRKLEISDQNNSSSRCNREREKIKEIIEITNPRGKQLAFKAHKRYKTSGSIKQYQ